MQDEHEILYPPLTFLEVTGTRVIDLGDGLQWTVIDAVPHL